MEGLEAAALGVDICELRELSSLGIGVELLEGSNVGLGRSRGEGPLVEGSVRVESQSGTGGGVLVVHPCDAGFAQLLEDAALWETVDVEGVVVGSVAVGGSRRDVGAIGVGRARDSSEPAIEQDKVLSHCVENTDLVWGVVVDNFSRARLVEGIVGDGLLGDEAAHVFVLDVHVGNLLIWVPGAEDWRGLA